MGNAPADKKAKPLDKQRLEIACIKVKAHLELQRDRRQNEVNAKEKALKSMIEQSTRSKQDEIHKASSVITDKNYVKACNIVIRFCDIIKDRSMHICDSKGKSDKIDELLPYIESIIWSAKPLNLNCIVEFQNLMTGFFGPTIYENVQKSTRVDPDLKNCFKELLPSPQEINNYFLEFPDRFGIALQKINQAGHEFASNFYEGGNSGSGGTGGFGDGAGGGGGMAIPGNYAEVNMPQQMQPQNFQPVFQPPVGYPQYQFPPQQQPGFPPSNGFIEPNFGPPLYQQPMGIPQQPVGFGAPGFGAPGFGAPGFGAPGFGAPGFGAPGFGAPGFGQPQQFSSPQQQVPIGPKDDGVKRPQQGGQAAGGYPDFSMNLPNNQNILNQIGGGAGGKPGGNLPQGNIPHSNNKTNVGGGGNDLPSLDDFEERMKRLREGL